MSSYDTILETYGSMAVKSAQMVQAARNSDWDQLVALEQQCRAFTEHLRRVEDGSPRPDADYVRRKAELIHKVLADDAEVRRLTEPWMAQLEGFIGSARQEALLRHAYQPDPR